MKYICDKPNDLSEYRPEGCKISPDNSILVYYYYRKGNASIDLDITNQLTDNFYDEDLHLCICIVDVPTGKTQELYTYNNITSTACICCVGNLNIQFSNDSKFLVIEGYDFRNNGHVEYLKFIRIYEIQRLDHVITPSLRYNGTFSAISYTDEILYYSPDTNTIVYGSILNQRSIKIYELRLYDKQIMPRQIYQYKHPIDTNCQIDHRDNSYEDYTCFIHTAKLLCNGTYIVLFINQMLLVHNLKTKLDRQIQIPGVFDVYNAISAIFNGNELIFGITEKYPERENDGLVDYSGTYLIVLKAKLDNTELVLHELYSLYNHGSQHYNVHFRIARPGVLGLYNPNTMLKGNILHGYTEICLADDPSVITHYHIQNGEKIINSTASKPFINRVIQNDGKYILDGRTFDELLTINQNKSK